MASPKVPKLDPRRGQNVGSSESPALFSLDWDPSEELRPFETRLQLWLRKAGRLPEQQQDPGERLFWGKTLEPAIGRALGELTGGWSVSAARFREHPAVEGMAASPDFEIRARDLPGGLALCEAKAVDRYEFRRWDEVEEPGVLRMRRRADGLFVPDEWEPSPVQPPFRIKLQVQHQLACTPDVEVGLIAALVGGNRLEVFSIPRHAGTIARIEQEVERFWESIAKGEPPDPDWMLDAETICAIYGESDSGTIVDLRSSTDAASAADLYAKWQEVEAEAKREKAAAKAKILALMDRAERAILADGFSVWAGTVSETEIAYTRAEYRGFKLTRRKPRRKPRKG